ncbi:MAG TPA: hypothetical protein VFY99_03520 [Solirubrobacterales bacterium]
MSRRAPRTVSLAAILLLSVFAGATAAAKAGDVTRHSVDLVWTPDNQDLHPGTPTIVDTFDSAGAPFGDQAAETRTPRDQMFEDTKRGKWILYLRARRPSQDPGVCKGTFEITKDVLETTATTQTVAYDGTMRIDGCRNTRKFRRVEAGRLGKVTGKSFCTVGSCRGGLKIKGQIRY